MASSLQQQPELLMLQPGYSSVASKLEATILSRIHKICTPGPSRSALPAFATATGAASTAGAGGALAAGQGMMLGTLGAANNAGNGGGGSGGGNQTGSISTGGGGGMSHGGGASVLAAARGSRVGAPDVAANERDQRKEVQLAAMGHAQHTASSMAMLGKAAGSTDMKPPKTTGRNGAGGLTGATSSRASGMFR